MSDRFKRSPALDYLGILPSEREWVVAVDLAAWGVLEHLDAERAENEARAMKNLPPLPSQFSRRSKPRSDTVTISVGGEKRKVPLPPPGCFYGPDGQLIRPDNGVRRF
jgi:hypothetical protein